MGLLTLEFAHGRSDLLFALDPEAVVGADGRASAQIALGLATVVGADGRASALLALSLATVVTGGQMAEPPHSLH